MKAFLVIEINLLGRVFQLLLFGGRTGFRTFQRGGDPKVGTGTALAASCTG